MRQDKYSTDEYYRLNPSLHTEDSLFKARAIINLIEQLPVSKLFGKGQVKILDVGGGAGVLSFLICEYLARQGARVDSIAYDLSRGSLKKQLENNRHISLATSDFEAVKCGAPYDLILLVDVIEHIEENHDFAEQINELATYVIYNIPLEKNLIDFLKYLKSLGNYYQMREDTLGHLHFYSLRGVKRFLKAHHEIVLLDVPNYYEYISKSTEASHLAQRRKPLRRLEILAGKLIFRLIPSIAPYLIHSSVYSIVRHKPRTRELASKSYWDSYHSEGRKVREMGLYDGLLEVLPSGVKKRFRSYYDFLLWETVLDKYVLPCKAPNQRAIEIGSAPGQFILEFSKRYDVEPFGLEYSSVGLAVNRELFASNDIDPANVICADISDLDVRTANFEKFDIVISRGFVEHFDNPTEIIKWHLELLRPGGLLVVLIPNLRGIYYFWTRVFNQEQLAIHNLNLMKLKIFESIFPTHALDTIKCGYLGVFAFWLFTARQKSLFRYLVRLLNVIQRFLDILFRITLRDKGFESRFFSPNLIYIGKKK